MVVVLAAALPWTAVAAGAQGSQESARFSETTTVSVVEVPVQVLAGGKPVRGLEAEDFLVLDNGRPRTLSSFEVVDLAVSPSHDPPSPSVAGRRKFLLLFDLVFTSPWDVARAEKAARRMVREDMAPSDLVAIGCFSSRRGVETVLNFTSDRQRALEVLDGLAFLLGGEVEEPATRGAVDSRRDPLRLSTAGWSATVRSIGSPFIALDPSRDGRPVEAIASSAEGGMEMKRALIATGVAAAVLAFAVPAAAEVDAHKVFEQIKDLEGLWRGTPEGQGEEAEAEAAVFTEVIHRFEVSAAGSIVMETMQPDTDHEMINMYFLDGEDLVVTHYCSSGNQPRMRLNRETSTESNLVFDFDGGTNLEQADHHIHSANIKLHDNGGVESKWYAASGDEIVGGMTFHLARAAGE